jgi:tellurite resistance protein TerC
LGIRHSLLRSTDLKFSREIPVSWLPSVQAQVLIGFHLFILLMLALDLGVFQRRAHAVSKREAAIWSAVWIAFALVFAVLIWRFWHVWRPDDTHPGIDRAIEFLTGYLIEKSLSVDNLFVFLVIFRYFAVKPVYQHRVLLWGIIGAVILRATLILLGDGLWALFDWMIYVFGAFLLYTAYKLARSKDAHIDPSRNRVLRLLRRFLPVVDDHDTPHFWVRRDGRLFATPLLIVVIVVESTDVMFALDSIPAIFAVTRDVFIVYTSNIFAILGLRALYFLLAGFLDLFRYLHWGLAGVLGFVGLKMLLEKRLRPFLEDHGIGEHRLVLLSLAVVAAILSVAVVASLIAGPKPEQKVQ